MTERIITIKNWFGRTVIVCPQLVLYEVEDYMGRDMIIPGIELVQITDEDEEPFEDTGWVQVIYPNVDAPLIIQISISNSQMNQTMYR